MTIRTDLRFLVGIAFLLAVFAGRALAAGSTINGMVFDSSRRGVVDVDVELQDEYSRYLGRTRTTGGGRFTFTNLAAGIYVVRVVGGRLGFSDQSQRVEIINFSRGSAGVSGDTVYVELYLRALPTSTWAETVGVASAVFVQEVPDPARRLFQEALAAIARKDDAAAVDKLRRALEIFPTYFDALNRIADELLKAQNFKAAAQFAARAVAVNPKAADSYYMLGYAQYTTGDFNAATESLRRSVNWSGRSGAAFLLLGMSLRRQKKFADSETQMLRADELTKQKSPDVQWQLALLYGHDMKRYKEAADRLELFLKLQPDNPDRASILKLVKEFRAKAG